MAGEETKRLWLTSLCSLAGPKAKDQIPTEVELTSDTPLSNSASRGP